MLIEASRFGQMEVDEDRLIRFERGVLGFPDNAVYALIQTGQNSAFYWLQATDRPELAFVVCDPRLFVPEYKVPIKAEELESMGLSSLEDAQVFVIVNKVDGMLTGNLQGPLVVNVNTRVARQMVLSDKRFSTRHPLMRVPARTALGQTA